jgi:hypothetical protein
MCVTNRGGQLETVRYRRQQLVSFRRNSRKTRQTAKFRVKIQMKRGKIALFPIGFS